MRTLLLLILIPVSAAAQITPFSAPENMEESVLWFIEANDNIRIAAYTFDSVVIATSLKGKNASVIVEKSPVGGLSDESRAVLCFLQDNNIEILLYDGPHRFMHAKYMTAGDTSLISSENVGDYNNRGWGVIIKDAEVAENLTYIFEEDQKESILLECDGYEFTETVKKGKQQPSFQGEASLIIAPDAVDSLLALLDTAKQRLWIEQFYIYRSWKEEDNLLLEKALEKDVDLRVILDGTWYNLDRDDENSNYYTNEYLGDRSKIVDTVKVHNKGAIIDNFALISSINWNENSPRNNREVGVVISGNAINYYVQRFEQDWNETESSIFPIAVAVSIFIFYLVIIRPWTTRRE